MKGYVLNARSGVGGNRKHFPKPVWRVKILVYFGWNTVASTCLVNMMTSTLGPTCLVMLREVERVVRRENSCLLLTEFRKAGTGSVTTEDKVCKKNFVMIGRM